MLTREKSGDVARARLAGVLREDRTSLSMKTLALMQLDVLAALSAYIDMERDRAHLSVTKDRANDTTLLTFTVPIRAARRK